jgi:acetyl esterase/lipase
MKLFIILISALVILTTLISCSGINPTRVLNASLSSAHYAAKLNIAYGVDARQKLDVYIPTAATEITQGNNKPVIVFIFGGAWRRGDKKDFKFIAHAFTRLGYRVVIPNYRLYPTVKFPTLIDDVADAIAHIEQHENTIGDLSQGMILMGHSSGAHAAALLATDQRYFKRRNINIPLKALIALAGPYDLTLDHPEVIPVFLPLSDESIAKPVRLVHNTMPPVLLLHGLKDTRVKPFHTQRFAEALHQAGIQHHVKLYEKVSHVAIISSIAAPLRSLNSSYDDIRDFLARLP